MSPISWNCDIEIIVLFNPNIAWVQAMPSLHDLALDCVLCTFNNISVQDWGKWGGLSGQATWTAHHVQDHTLLGHSPPASQAGRRIGPASSLRAHGPTYAAQRTIQFSRRPICNICCTVQEKTLFISQPMYS